MEDRHQSDGQIFTNNFKQAETQPDWTGKIVLSKGLLKELVKKIKSGNDAEMRVALWDRVSKNGNEYKYARFDIPQQQKKVEKKEDVFDIDDDDIPF